MDQVKPQWRYPAIILPCLPTLQRQNAENLKQIFPEKEYRGLSPNFHIHVSVSELYCIFPRWVCLFCWRKYVDRSWEYKNRLQTHECWNWGWGRAIPRKGIYKRNCRCSVVWFIQQTICLMWLVIYKMQFMWVVTTWCSCDALCGWAVMWLLYNLN